MAFGASVIIGTALSGRYLQEFALTSPRFSIKKIEIQLEKKTPRASRISILKLADVKTGDNLFAIDPDEVAQRVEVHPWVRRATVSRAWPDALKITLEEHRPAVLVALGHLYYADKSGEIFKRYAPGERLSWPVITGLSRAEIEAEDEGGRDRLRSAVRFLEELKVLGTSAPKISEIHLEPLGLSFIEDTGLKVVVGSAPWRERLLRLPKVKAKLASRGVAGAEIWLGGPRRNDRVVARLEKGREP